MLAFIDSPIQIAIVMIVVLLVFGPEKMKDIGKQMGRAIREIRRAGADFKSTIEGEDNRYDADYNPPRYDSYGNSYHAADHLKTPSIPEEDMHPAITAAPHEDTPRGDFAAAALSSEPAEFGSAPHPSSASETAQPAAPVYGVLSTPEQSVPREKTTAPHPTA